VSAPGNNRLPVLAAEIRSAHEGVEIAARTAAERAVAAGKALIEAKALLPHGAWLPWLREHCRIPERSVQFYMRIAKLGLESATIAEIGLAAAAKAVVLHYDPFAGLTDGQREQWLEFRDHLVAVGSPAEWAEDHITWILRHQFRSPDEWLGPEGRQYRATYRIREPSAEFVAGWIRRVASAGGVA
jgi:hypothetical protein